MKYTLYQFLIPASIRQRIYASNIQHYEKVVLAQLKDNQCLPHDFDLSSVYISNLRIVTDRYALLNSMPIESKVAHVGAGDGELSAEIQLTSKPKKLFLIDKYELDNNRLLSTIHRKFNNEIYLGQIQVKNGPPADELAALPDAELDWVYLNIDPSYEVTANILEISKRKVRPGGLISGGDYSRGPWPDRKKFGVIEAVHEFCKKHAWEMVYLTHEPCRQLSYTIKKIESAAQTY